MVEFLKQINNIRFISIDEIYMKRFEIKENYEKLSDDNKELYKWYFYYQLSILKNPLKRRMWEFINDECECEILNNEYINFCNDRESLVERIKFQKEKRLMKNRIIKQIKKDGI